VREMDPTPLSTTGRVTDSRSGRCIESCNQNTIQKERKDVESCGKKKKRIHGRSGRGRIELK